MINIMSLTLYKILIEQTNLEIMVIFEKKGKKKDRTI